MDGDVEADVDSSIETAVEAGGVAGDELVVAGGVVAVSAGIDVLPDPGVGSVTVV